MVKRTEIGVRFSNTQISTYLWVPVGKLDEWAPMGKWVIGRVPMGACRPVFPGLPVDHEEGIAKDDGDDL